MEGLIILVVLVVLASPIGLIVSFVRQSRLSRKINKLQETLHSLEHELNRIKETGVQPARPSRASVPLTPPAVVQQPLAAEPIIPVPSLESRPLETPVPGTVESLLHARTPEIQPSPVPQTPPPILPPVSAPRLEMPPEAAPVAPVAPERPRVVDWEKFLGVKLFAWVGGLALFLGVAFFVKYSFERNLIPPEMRVALGFLVGLGLVVGGVVMRRKEFAVTAQTLCATGVVVLYGVSFAAHALYHLIGSVPVFALMTLVTATAFVLAIRMDAIVVAVLGLVGGFLTPPLLSTGQDNPLGLFSYVFLLNAGLIAVALYREWRFLLVLGAIGTGIMEAGWMEKFFAPAKTNIALTVLALFNGVFLAAVWLENRFARSDEGETPGFNRISDRAYGVAALLLQALLTFGVSAYFISLPELLNRPWTILSAIFMADLAILAVLPIRPRFFRLHLLGGGCVFLLLAFSKLDFAEANIFWALGSVLLFAILHSVYPLVLQRVKRIEARAVWSNLFPLAGMGLMLLLLTRLEVVSLVVWPIVLLLDLLIIGVAFFTGTLVSAMGAVLLTAIFTTAWIFKIPADWSGTGTILIIGIFAVLFFGAGFWLFQRAVQTAATEKPNDPVAKYLPATSAVLPFLLLALMVLRFDTANPSNIFGLALVLNGLLLWLSRRVDSYELTAVALGATIFLESFWSQSDFRADRAGIALTWHLIFYALFLVFPFAIRRVAQMHLLPWAASALSGPLHFYMMHKAITALLPGFPVMGLVPAVLAVPSLLGLIAIAREFDVPREQQIRLLAWFGGSALFFVTLIFPIQWHRQWLTVGWALEGLALLWLFHRVPHRGLPIVGVALLVVAFTRLALNPTVFQYYPRSEARILNWYLYSYGIVTACLLLGARLLAPPRHLVLGRNVLPLLYTLGTVLAFILLNIEIADFFAEGDYLRFDFTGRLGRDMTYSIAWALFALALLIIGVKKEVPPARYASLALLGATLIKLFLHDLRRLEPPYRIGAFIGVALILILSSWIYQRYLASPATRKEG